MNTTDAPAPPNDADNRPIADVSQQRIARVYAEALLAAALKRNEAENVLAELNALEQRVQRPNPIMAAFFTSGVISRDNKARTIRTVFENRSSELLVNFLLVLNDHDRLNLLRAIHAAYQKLLDERAGRMYVQVRSAVPLAGDQADKLRSELRATFQREPQLETRVDPELLGGLVVQLGDWVYDGSVRTRLQHLKNQILMESSHAIQGGRDRFSIKDGD